MTVATFFITGTFKFKLHIHLANSFRSSYMCEMPEMFNVNISKIELQKKLFFFQKIIFYAFKSYVTHTKCQHFDTCCNRCRNHSFFSRVEQFQNYYREYIHTYELFIQYRTRKILVLESLLFFLDKNRSYRYRNVSINDGDDTKSSSIKSETDKVQSIS